MAVDWTVFIETPEQARAALEAYRQRKITTAQLRRLLGFETRYELDGYLKAHEIWLDYTADDLERDRATHAELGL